MDHRSYQLGIKADPSRRHVAFAAFSLAGAWVSAPSHADTHVRGDHEIMALPDLVWRILLQKGVQDRYETWLSDAMPKPKKEYLVPVFDQETWDHMMHAIKEALEIWKEQVIKNALEPEPGRMIRNSEWDHETSEF